MLGKEASPSGVGERYSVFFRFSKGFAGCLLVIGNLVGESQRSSFPTHTLDILHVHALFLAFSLKIITESFAYIWLTIYRF